MTCSTPPSPPLACPGQLCLRLALLTSLHPLPSCPACRRTGHRAPPEAARPMVTAVPRPPPSVTFGGTIYRALLCARPAPSSGTVQTHCSLCREGRPPSTHPLSTSQQGTRGLATAVVGQHCVGGWVDGWTDRQIDRWTDRQIDGWTDRQIDGWTDGWSKEEREGMREGDAPETCLDPNSEPWRTYSAMRTPP